MARKYKCPYCNNSYIRKDLVNHIDKEHDELLGDDHTSSQIVFDLVNGTKGHGKCRVCGKPTNWNESSARYSVLCNNPKCKEYMREEYKKNMLKVYNTYNILTSDEQQKKMLANRKISGKYKFKDGGIVTYTGSYEKKFLQFIDIYMNIPSKDIMAPGPTIEYEMNREKHFYITDFLYIPYNAIIEIKDGGSNLNHKDSEGMRSSRQRTIEKEKIITNQGVYNYLRLTDNQFMQFLEFCMEIKRMLIEGRDDKIIKVNENYITEATKNSKYYICLKSYEGKTLTSKPSIPKDNFLIDKGYEDGKTSRVCASNSINGCLMAMSMNLKNKDLFVYSVDFNNDNLPYKPTKAEVPDAHVTGEVWFKKPVTLKYIGKIHVDEADKDVVYASDIAGIKNPAVVDWKYHFVERINESAEDNKVSLNQYKQIDMAPRNINKYGLTRVNPMCDGYIYIDEKNNNGVVGYVSVEKKSDGRKWIQSVEVEVGYRNIGLMYQLINIACRRFGAKFISINKINKSLKKICEDYGFKVYDQNKYTYFMTTNEELVKDLKSTLKENSFDNIMNYTSLNENILFSNDDLYYNIDKFENGDSNVLLVTGLSGSGKSTIGKQLSNKYKAEYIELDLLDIASNFVTEKNINAIKSGEPIMYEFLMKNKIIFDKLINKDVSDDEMLDIMEKYIRYILLYAKNHKNKKFVIDGIQIFDCDALSDTLVKYPIIIKGTSSITSFIRKVKRDKWEIKDIIKNMPQNIKYIFNSEKKLNLFKNILKESTIHMPLKESAIDDAIVFKDVEDLYKWMDENIKYDHSIKLRSADEVYKDLKGDCHDQAEFEHVIMTKMGIPHGRFFLIAYSDNSKPWYEQQCGATHTALWYKTDRGYFWFENAWHDNKGIHGPYNTERRVMNDIFSEFKKSNNRTKYKYAYICNLKNVKPGMDLNEYVMANYPESLYNSYDNLKSFYMVGVEKARTNLISIYSDYNLNGLKITNPYYIDDTNTYVIAQINNRQCTKEDLDNVIAEINSDNRFTVYGKNGYFRVFKKATRSSNVILIAIEININD